MLEDVIKEANVCLHGFLPLGSLGGWGMARELHREERKRDKGGDYS